MKNLTLIWDPLVRLFHWSLVLSFCAAWLSGDDFEKAHIIIGYIIVGLVAFRLVWGFFGSPYARFSQFVKSPAKVVSYIKDIAKGREKRYLGHNPAGGMMIVFLLLGIAGLCLTGWMYTTDMFWGSDWVEGLHKLLANGLVLCIGLHVTGVIVASKRHGENLIKAMFTGKKQSHIEQGQG
ncbi:cytochrome b/b6 domain-containing protein [Terasakiella pusilla]|uniref:cytochrome b/b6 domain-containing protein n=1 Tax=Terasakiella pusilla TaxID=64973 RepID=UPI003AA83B31